MDSPKRPRNRAACRRCQRRKIRCDGNLPSCGSCQKAGVSCVNDGRQEVHRSYITNMENRMRWLESIVRERCSNIDLDRGPEDQTEAPSRTTVQPDAPLDSTQDIARNNHATAHLGSSNRHNYTYQETQSELPPHDRPTHQVHEIGLVSLSPGGDPRYIGPSSGFPFARRIFNRAGCRDRPASGVASTSGASRLSVELLGTPTSLPRQKETALELSKEYFRSVHLLYPLLHEHSHMQSLERVYDAEDENPLDSFQVYMVLAIAALNLSRQCKVHLPVEGYYASAMEHVDYICNHGSMAALQCLLLLMIYALYNPSCNVNIWNLNYQCLASVIDLGLQRDVRASPSLQISVFDQEMRTRVFWVAYTFDRTVCTMMGRPIGIRDEACEIRFPLDISDTELIGGEIDQQSLGEARVISHMSYSIHLFRLAQFNSEIKYVMHSICRSTPAYAFPPLRDIFTWQKDMISSLQTWLSQIPMSEPSPDNEMTQYCKIKYHEMMILLLRPSPGIPNPADEMFDLCYQHTVMLLESFGELYAAGRLLYSRLVVHSIILGTMVMLHYIWKFPRTATKLCVDELIARFNVSQNILSSIGEHWAEATRARDCVAELSSVTVQRLLRKQPLVSVADPSGGNTRHIQQGDSDLIRPVHAHQTGDTRQVGVTTQEPLMSRYDGRTVVDSSTIAPAQIADFEFPNLFDDLLQADFQGWSGMSDIDGLMWEIFN